MNSMLLLLVGIIYLGIGVNYGLEGKTGLMISFIAYAVANYGLFLAGKT